MPLRLDINRRFHGRSDRVKCVEFHPKEPWILTSLYSGIVCIWNHETDIAEKNFEVTDPPGVPVRCAKFIARKHWIVTGSDDMKMRIFNYNTLEKIHVWEAHYDYIRSIAVHPTLPYILSSSDDLSIKLWDWDKDFTNTILFEGHTHYIMQIEINPKDTNTFASASLDHTVKVWGLTSPSHYFSLEGHTRGVNCVSYLSNGDRPFLVSGSDDFCVKVWDYQAKSCVATLSGHIANISAVCFHPRLPIILSGSEDGTIRIWHSTTFRLENTLDYGMDRTWSISTHFSSNKVAIGYDLGTLMLQLGQEEPIMSMDGSGNVVWVENHQILFSNVRSSGNSEELSDGEIISLSSKDLGNCEIYPQMIKHSPNGRTLVICGDGEYIVYTARVLKNMSFGSAIEFVWSNDSKLFAVRESNTQIKIYQNYKEIRSFRPVIPMESIFGGYLLGIRSSEYIDFYDWSTLKIIRRISVSPKLVFWSENGSKVALICQDVFYVLGYNEEIVQKFLNEKIETDEQGIENSFEIYREIHESVTTGYFAGDFCFIYTTKSGLLKYFVGDLPEFTEIITLAHLDRPMYLLRYLPKESKIFLMDKKYKIVAYNLLVNILAFQIDVVSNDFESARKRIVDIPIEHHNKLALFLESQGHKEMALEVSKDDDHRFELAWQLGKLKLAREIIVSSETEKKWKQLGDKALQLFDLDLAEECAKRSKDVSLLLLLYTSKGDLDGLLELAQIAESKNVYNLAFLCFFLSNRISEAIDLLIRIDRIPEAAFFARTYAPSQINDIVLKWREKLSHSKNPASKTIISIDDNSNNSDFFPDYLFALKAEKFLNEYSKNKIKNANDYLKYKNDIERDIIEEAKTDSFKLYNTTEIEPETDLLTNDLDVLKISDNLPVSDKNNNLQMDKNQISTNKMEENDSTGLLDQSKKIAENLENGVENITQIACSNKDNETHLLSDSVKSFKD